MGYVKERIAGEVEKSAVLWAEGKLRKSFSGVCVRTFNF